jgi:LmbE family N-acetylglucosaminyl deacetylase
VLRLPLASADLRRLLLIGAHPDDIEIGAGGALMRLLAERPDLEVCWVVLTAAAERAAEAERSAAALLEGVEGRIVRHAFRDGFLPYLGAEVKEAFEQLKRQFAPDLVLTHSRLDAHQDHRLTAELTWNTFRDHLILEYEIPKYDGDLGTPSLYVPLSADQAQEKARHLMRHFPSQACKRWFSEDLFLGLMRLRGIECNAPERYAEAFYCRKLVV